MILLNSFLLLMSFMCCQANEWHGIVPLKSTRADVEKILGKPTPDSIARHAAAYKTKNERVSVLFSTGPCNVKPSNGWNIPELTVISIMVEPDTKPKFTDFKFDEHRFEKRPDPKILDATHYTNENDGISIEVDETDGSIAYFRYFPASKNYDLKCK